MPRGGRGQPKPGAQYPNRSDYASGPKPQPVKTATGQPYGTATQQAAAQHAIPLPTMSGGGGGNPVPPNTPPAAAPSPGPLTPLHAPSARPDEPVTAGAPFGAGPGPTATGDTSADQLRALYQRFPTEDLRRLLEVIDTGGG